MGAVFALEHACIAKPPGTIEADFAVPVAVVGARKAKLAEGTFLQHHVGAFAYIWIRRWQDSVFLCWLVSTRCEYMGLLVCA